jgi:hypothetical protein
MEAVDPFHSVQNEVSQQLDDIIAQIKKWKKLSSKSPKHEPTRQRILSSLSELQVDLQDMQATIDIALRDPGKFALTPSELMTRQTFVRDLQAQANDARDTLDPTIDSGRQGATPAGDSRNDRTALMEAGGISTDGGWTSCESASKYSSTRREQSGAYRDNADSIATHQQQQQQQFAEQEQELGVLGGALDRLGNMGKVINDELKAQGRELDAMNEVGNRFSHALACDTALTGRTLACWSQDVDSVSSRMHQATDAMKKMLKRKDRWKICAILVLSLVLILLMYAVIAW